MSELATAPDPAGAPASAPADDRHRRLSSLLDHRFTQATVSPLAFIVIFGVYGIWLGTIFLNSDARLLDIHQNVPLFVVALGVLVTLIAGQFDLSVGSMATLACYLTVGLPVLHDWGFVPALLVVLVIGVAGGLLNGVLVVSLGINAFIATLGTGGIFLGLSQAFSGGSAISPDPSSSPLASWFTGPGSLGDYGTKMPAAITWAVLVALAVVAVLALRRLRPSRFTARAWLTILTVATVIVAALLLVAGLGTVVDQVSWSIGILIAVSVLLGLLLTQTTFGRYLFATGSNATAARLARVNTNRETLKAFALGGFLAALGGVLLAANQGAAASDVGVGYLLPAFSAVFLSTVMFSSGKFTVYGTVMGGTFLVWVGQGLVVGGVAFQWTTVVNGVMLVLAVAASTVLRRRVTR
jgi:ribose/xylose/arabinose/galactoside ABC-type transport system permease subunit